MGPHLVAEQLSRILNPRCLQAETGHEPLCMERTGYWACVECSGAEWKGELHRRPDRWWWCGKLPELHALPIWKIAMTLDLSAAKRLALEYLAEQQAQPGGVPCAIVDSRVVEDNEGWYFPYQSVEFLTTGDINASLVGNWPVFVSRDGLRVGPRRPDKLR
ncbi:hypothetical protein C6Q12_06145 [Burkholderia multivorans]|nr:hypothetical protein C6Q12_06145 [Burkholderia multivorans]